MKRFLLSAVVAIALVGTIEAQTKFWVGGSFSISSSDHDPNKDHSFILMPEFGYRINDNWAVGGMLGFRSFTTETGDFEQKNKLYFNSAFCQVLCWWCINGTFLCSGQSANDILWR